VIEPGKPLQEDMKRKIITTEYVDENKSPIVFGQLGSLNFGEING
jgi:hypothetical protein